MKLAKYTLFASSLTLFAAAGIAHAQFKLPGMLGGGAKNEASATGGPDASISSDSLVRSFVDSNKEILNAQSLLELAYGDKNKAALLQSESDALKSDGVSTDQLKKVVELSNQTNEELAAKQAQHAKLSVEEKKYYAQSLPHFARGVLGTRKLVADVSKFGTNAKNSLMGGGLGAGMAKMKEGMFVAKATPSYSKNVFDTFRKTVLIGRSNGVKMPADATSALSGLE